jgi:hypothetical protein
MLFFLAGLFMQVSDFLNHLSSTLMSQSKQARSFGLGEFRNLQIFFIS